MMAMAPLEVDCITTGGGAAVPDAGQVLVRETERSDQRHTPPEILLIMIVTEITINSQMASRNDDDDDDITNKI